MTLKKLIRAVPARERQQLAQDLSQFISAKTGQSITVTVDEVNALDVMEQPTEEEIREINL